MAREPRQLAVQAARVLDHLQTLREYYGEEINQAEPELAEAIDQIINALGSFVSRTVGAASGSKS